MDKLFHCLIIICLLSAMPGLGVSETTGSAGAAEINLLNLIFNGYIGFALGLLIVTIGIFEFAMGRTERGVTLIILGVLITLLPGLYNAMIGLFCPAVNALSGGAARCGL